MVATKDKTQVISLETFLGLPEVKPAQEYSQGIVTQKSIPQAKHSILQVELASAINQQAKAKKLAYALPELRCSFAGRSIVPDIAVIRWHHLPRDNQGDITDRFDRHPDWIIEIMSPDQSVTLVMEKIIFCLHQGTELGWLIDPTARSVAVFQTGLPQIHLEIDQNQDPLAVLAGLESWQITAREIFAWLTI